MIGEKKLVGKIGATKKFNSSAKIFINILIMKNSAC